MSARAHEVPGTLRPSSAPQWGPGGCSGSFAMQLHYPEDEESEKAREGTAGHWAATEGVQGRPRTVGMLAPNGYPINQEMLDGADHFIRDVLSEAMYCKDGGALFRVETKVFAHAYVHPHSEGTPDAFLVDPGRRLIVVWDYKYGHRIVAAFRNWQLINYLAAVLEGCGYGYDDLLGWTISLRIVQPRDYRNEPVKSWDFPGEQAFAHIGQLATAAKAAKLVNAPCIPGDYCRDCTASHACEALRAVGGYAMDVAGESTPHELDNVGLGLELRALDRAMKRLEARRTGLQEVVIAKIQSGQAVTGWTLGRGDTRETWTAPPEEVFLMGDTMGVDLRQEAKPITPAQARKAGVPEQLTKAYAQKPAGAVKLMPADASDAAKAFS